MIRQTLVAMTMAGLMVPVAAGLEQIQRNVLVIVLDDLGTDQLALYNENPCGICTLPVTPYIDELAEQGIRFTRAHGNPVCSATRACIQTGRYGLRTGVGNVTSSTSTLLEYELNRDEVLLAELVKDGRPPPLVKYKCGAFGKWHLSTSTDYMHPTDNGYDRFQGTMGNVSVGGNHFYWEKVDNQDPNSPQWIGSLEGPFTRMYWQSSVASDDAVEWINAQTKPFLAYVCFNAPHWPLQVPPLDGLPEITKNQLQAAWLEPGDKLPSLTDPNAKLVYRAMVEAVDYEIGNLTMRINQLKYSNTMVFVIGDNGTEKDLLCQCIPPSPPCPPPTLPFGGKGTLYETGIRIPLIVSGPLVFTDPGPNGGPPWTSDALVDAVDLWRTIANIAGADIGAANPLGVLDSKSFLSVIQNPGGATGNRTHTFSQLYYPNGTWPPLCGDIDQRSVSNGTFKLVRSQMTTGSCLQQDFLVDVVNDPNELCDLGTSHSEYSGLLSALTSISGP